VSRIINFMQHTLTKTLGVCPHTQSPILKHTAAHCTAAHCSTLQHCDTLRHIDTATQCNTLQHTATHCSTLQHTATHCKHKYNTQQRTATQVPYIRRDADWHITSHYNILHHTATHCNTLQHTVSSHPVPSTHTSFTSFNIRSQTFSAHTAPF